MHERAWALGFLVASGAYLAASLAFPLGSVAKPGPGFFPVGVGVFLCAAAVALAVALFRGAAAVTVGAGLAGRERVRVLVTVGGLAGFCLLLPWLGYPACAFLFVVLVLRCLGGGRWPGVVLTAALSAFGSYYLFGVLLGVPLPRGPF
ncbi:MAG TPA: tripartite tricarboxylate transporter TctB family protein [Methylomirabilota bacterium]|nr:tripartite tricarboxylate transporter TctB family protein [Methylomirabilota bacterium]